MEAGNKAPYLCEECESRPAKITLVLEYEGRDEPVFTYLCDWCNQEKVG